MKVHIRFAMSKSPDTSILYKMTLWVEFKDEKFPKFCDYCRLITHNSRFCEVVSDVFIAFGEKNAQFGEWLHSNMNMKVPAQVNEGRFSKKSAYGFVFSVGNISEKKGGG